MIEFFKILKEIDSLDRNYKELQSEIEKEESRITNIQSKIKEKEKKKRELIEKSKEVNTVLIKSENDLNLNQIKKDQKEAQRSQVFTENQIAALKKEIQMYTESIEKQEEDVFSLMENKEEILSDINDCTFFLKGVQKALLEITEEVSLKRKEIQKKQENLHERITSLKNELPQNFQNKVESLLSQNLRSTILANIKNSSCNYCRSSFAIQLTSEIEDKYLLKTCSACKRILMPSTVAFY